MTELETTREITASEPHVPDKKARAAAVRAISAEILLDGEDPFNANRADAEHWINAYSELISYKEALLSTSSRKEKAMENESALAETRGVDVVILKRELENSRRRLAYWLRRLDEFKSEESRRP